MIRVGPSPSCHLHLRRSHGGAGRPLLLLHDLGSSAAAFEGLMGSLTGKRPLWAPDLPSHGLSDGGAVTPAQMADLIAQVLSQGGLTEVDVVAEGASAALALALDAAAPGRIHGLLLCNPVAVPGGDPALARALLPPDLAADAAGAYLLRAWGYLKDRDLYTPWHSRTPECATPQIQPRRPAELQRALTDLLRARPVLAAALEAALTAASWETLAASRARIAVTPGSPAVRHFPGAQALPAERVNWNWPLLEMLG